MSSPFSTIPKNNVFAPYSTINTNILSLSDLNSTTLINRGLSEADAREIDWSDEELYMEQTPVESIKELAIYAFAKLCSITVVNPLHVASTALQVQYLPSDVWLRKEKAENANETDEYDEEYFGEDERFREDSDAEFCEDIYAVPTKNSTSSAFADSRVPSASTDHLGYVVPTDADVEDDAVRPVYQLPPIEKGVWDAMTMVVKHPTEGWQGLWKGTFTTWLHQMAQVMLQPSLETLLNDSFGIQNDDYLDLAFPNNKPMVLRPDLATVVFSSAVVGWVLSPLELVKTRLIVQTSSPAHRKYNGVIDCLKTTIAEEGIHHLYMDSTLLVPTLLTHTLLPLIANTRRVLIGSIFYVDPHESPLLHSLADLTFSMMELLITLPLETVRKRLQVQRRVRVQQGKPFSSCVQLSQRPYKGVWDCVQRIIREEGGHRDTSKRRRRRKVGGERFEGSEKGKEACSMGLFGWRKYRGLYKGSTVKFGANLTVFVINCFGGSEVEAEW